MAAAAKNITKVNLDGTYYLTYATGETECISELTLQEILGAMEEHQWLNNEAQMARFTLMSTKFDQAGTRGLECRNRNAH